MRTVIVIFAALLVVLAPSIALGAETGDESASTEARWIDVDLTNLVATAYEGDVAVHSAPFTGGMPGWETPRGVFKIQRRVVNETMDSTSLGIPRGQPGYYFAPNVRYTQYITQDGVALHGNYWAAPEIFGHRNTSHGCVSFTDDEAAFFWDFATIGTPVVIHTVEDAPIFSVLGRPLAEARTALERAGFTVDVRWTWEPELPEASVVAQSPAAPDRAPRGSTIQLSVNRSAKPIFLLP